MAGIGKVQLNLTVTAEWDDRVRQAAIDRKTKVSDLVMGYVTEGLNEDAQIAEATANPVFMEAMKEMFGNPQTMRALVEMMQQTAGGVSPDQMKLFGNGLDAFASVVQKGGKEK